MTKDEEFPVTFKKRQRQLWMTFFLTPVWFLPLAIAFEFITNDKENATAGPVITFSFFVLVLAPFVIASARVISLRCPVCQRLFHYRGFFGNIWTRNCVHCGSSANETSSANTH